MNFIYKFLLLPEMITAPKSIRHFFGVYLKRPRMGLQMKAVAGPKRLNKPSMMHTAISTAFLINIFYRSVH